MENWKKIWNNKGSVEINSVQDLINANGYETSGLSYFNLLPFIDKLTNKLKSKNYDSFYEVGCGSGTILYILKKLGFFVGGCDYSKSLIKIANSLDISEDIKVLSADEIDVNKKYDHLISMSVFQYFPNNEYVSKVLDLMLEKSNKSVSILDINDEDKKEIYLNIRREVESDYDEKYKGYEHLFINKKFWEEYASNKNLNLIIENQNIEGYKNEKFRYNVYLTKI